MKSRGVVDTFLCSGLIDIGIGVALLLLLFFFFFFFFFFLLFGCPAEGEREKNQSIDWLGKLRVRARRKKKYSVRFLRNDQPIFRSTAAINLRVNNKSSSLRFSRRFTSLHMQFSPARSISMKKDSAIGLALTGDEVNHMKSTKMKCQMFSLFFSFLLRRVQNRTQS